jgi:Cytochrome P450
MADLQNDLLMWHMTRARGVEKCIEGFARRMLMMNLAAIHTTSTVSVDISIYYTFLIIARQQTVTQVLYRLLANPEYLEPLREEVDAAIREEGWTKAGIDKMYKLDSFLRETQRLDGFAVRPLDSLRTSNTRY